MSETLLQIWKVNQDGQITSSQLPFFSARRVVQNLKTRQADIVRTVGGSTLSLITPAAYDMTLSFEDETPPAFSHHHVGQKFVVDSLLSFTETLDPGQTSVTLDRLPAPGSLTYRADEPETIIETPDQLPTQNFLVELPKQAAFQSFLRYRPRFMMILTDIETVFDERNVTQRWDLHWSED